MTNVLFDQYQRYKKTQEIVNTLRQDDKKFNILEVGANEHRNLESFLPEDKVTYLDINLPEELKNDPQYILGDATQMSFEDNTYDLVVALDVFEHIPADKRKAFIDEISRVAKLGFILMGPFDTKGVALAEKSVNTFFKTLVGCDHPWLIEHINNGLPDWEQTKQYLEEKEIKFISLQHGTINMWEKMMRYHFLSVYSNKVLNDIEDINRFYNEHIYAQDKGDLCYRKIIVGSKYVLPNLERITTFNDTDSTMQLNQIEAEFYQKLCKAYDEKDLLVLKDNHINNLQDIINARDSYIKEIEPLIELKETHINNIEAILNDKEQLIVSELKEIQLKEDHIRNIETQLQIKNDQIRDIEEQIQLKDNHIRNIETQLQIKNDQIRDIEEQIQLKDNHIDNIETQIRLKDNHINNIQKTVDALTGEIENLREDNRSYQDELNRIYSTILGKILKKFIYRNR